MHLVSDVREVLEIALTSAQVTEHARGLTRTTRNGPPPRWGGPFRVSIRKPPVHPARRGEVFHSRFGD